MDPLFGWFLLLIFIPVVIIALSAKTTTPAPQRLEEWAKKNEFQIVSAEKRRFFIGPFMWRKGPGPGALFYRIVVRGPKEEVGEGWLCLQHSLFGKDSEEVKWIRRPAHTMDPPPEVALSPSTRKWAGGVFLALVLIVLGLASLASGRFVIPSRRSFVAEGTPAILLAVALISFGLFFHLHLFWDPNPKADHQKWLRLFEQLSPIYKWTPGGLRMVQSCPRRRASLATNAKPRWATRGAPRIAC